MLRPIFKILLPADLAVNFRQTAIIKNIPPHLKRVATLPCEIFVLKNRHVPELSEANCHARLSHSKQLLKNIHSLSYSIILFTDEKIFTVATSRQKPTERPTVCTCSNQEE